MKPFNLFNPRKLMLSKWTALHPERKEKHFMVTKLYWDEEKQLVINVDLEAVMTKNIYNLSPEDLKSKDKWMQGWK